MVKVAIVGTNGLPANYGGFETLVDYLTKNIVTGDIDFTVYCSKTKRKEQLNTYNNAKLVYLPLKANGGQSILYDFLSLIKVWFKYDRVLLLGTSGALIIPFLKLLKNTKLITNFGGFEWKRDKWNYFIRLFLKWSESVSIYFSDKVIADNQIFVDYIKKKYNKKSQLIEYGGDHVNYLSPSDEIKKIYPFLNYKYSISISRVQPDNQIHVLLEAFVRSTTKDSLVVISNWNNSEYGKKLLEKYNSIDNLFLLNAVYDIDILNILRGNASYYIHTHSFCGTAPSLVEAMNYGLPIISYDAETNLETTENKAIYFHTVNELKDLLSTLNPETLKSVAEKMKEIAKRRYTWKIISNKYFNELKK